MSRDDFMVSTPPEFSAICKAHASVADIAERNDWEQTRTICTFLMAPYSKNKNIRATDTFSLPWDTAGKGTGKTVAEMKKEADDFAKRHKITTI